MEKLFLGVAREKITPEVGGQLYGYRPDVFSTSVEDDLNITAFYFRQGDVKALMMSAEVCLVQTELAAGILSAIGQRFGIPKENCILSATHTHSGPNTAGQAGWGDIDREYCDEIFVPAILSAVGKAIGNAQPVKMGAAAGNSPVGINRRELNTDNRIILGQNPWGSFDPKMTVISFIDEQGDRVANMIHYGCHGTCAGTNNEITRDWSGLMIDAVEQKSGAVTAFFNGPEGDVGPRISNGLTMGDLSYVRELGAVAARDAVGIFERICDYTEAELRVSEKTLCIPLKPRMDRSAAEEMLKYYKDKKVNAQKMIKDHLEDVIASYENGFVDEQSFEISQTAVALGSIVFAASPFELFSEIGMRIDKAVGGVSVLSLSNANGSEGYFVTEDALCRGGYEVSMFKYGHRQSFCDDADFRLMKQTAEHVQQIFESEE